MRRWAMGAGLVAVLGIATGCDGAPDPVPGSEQHTPEPAWERVAPPADLPRDRALRVGFLILEGVFNTELTAPFDIFHHTPFHTEPEPGMQVFTISPDGLPVTSFEGLRIAADYGFDNAPQLDVLVVPSADGNMDRDLADEALLEWVGTVGRDARWVMSLCDGAFVLAAAGLLDGHAVTTFPGDQDHFAETFRDLDLRREPSFVHDGNVITSQGGAKSFDAAMYLVDHIWGVEVAQGVGKGLIIDWPPTRRTMAAVVVSR